MRSAAALTAAVITSLTAVAGAQAAQSITADPVRVNSADVQTVRGRGWPVIEFCSRTVRVPWLALEILPRSPRGT